MRAYHSANIEQARVGSLALWNSLDTSLFNVELAREPLQFRIGAVAVLEALSRNGAAILVAVRRTLAVTDLISAMARGLLLHVRRFLAGKEHVGVGRTGACGEVKRGQKTKGDGREGKKTQHDRKLPTTGSARTGKGLQVLSL